MVKRYYLLVFVIMLLAACSPTATPRSETPPPTETPSPSTATASPPTATATPAATPTPVLPTPPPLEPGLPPRTGWWNDAIFYEVFVRSFYDADGDGIGDLPGLIEKLDYLNDGDPATDTDLGVTALWLMPVMQSPSYHGYDIMDYYTIEEDYGVNADFKQLIAAAHQRGIRVIIDLVMNHTSSEHPWFQESEQGPDSEWRDWYVWSDKHPMYTGPWGQSVWYRSLGGYYYAVFWSEMPDLNYTNPVVTEEMYKVAHYWLEELGADGFRLDAVRYLIEENIESSKPVLASGNSNLNWLADFRNYYISVAPEAMTVGEVWADTTEVKRYINNGALDMTFEFNLAETIMNSVLKASPSEVRSKVNQVLADYPANAFATFLTNHDQNRVMHSLLQSPERAKLAAATYLTLPGTPFIYYGEEIGMTGAKPDELIRTPMQWSNVEHAGFTSGRPWQAVNNDYETVNVAAQTDDPASLLSYYRKLLHLRGQYTALRTGAYTEASSSNPLIYAYLRSDEESTLLVVLNYAPKDIADVVLSLPDNVLAPGTYSAQDLLTAAAMPDLTITNNAAQEYPLPALTPRQVSIILLQPR